MIHEGEEFRADREKQNQALRAITTAAWLASLVAIIMIAIVVTVLFIVNKEYNSDVGYIIEGVSKVVAAIFIFQLSYKLPKWLGVYAAPKKDYKSKVSFCTIVTISRV